MYATVYTGSAARKMRDTPSVAPTGRVGTSGKPLQYGRVEGYEHNPRLTDRLFFAQASMMLRDTACFTPFWLTQNLLCGADWRVAGGADVDERAKDYLGEAFNLRRTGRMRGEIEDYVRESSFALVYGCDVHESELYRADGAVWVRGLHYVHPESIEAWLTDGHDDLVGVRQTHTVTYDDSGNTHWTYPEIARNRMVYWALNRIGTNFDGLALFRPMHPLWDDRRELQDALAIGAAKYATPTPVARIDPEIAAKFGITTPEQIEAERDAIAAILKDYVTHEEAYITLPPWVTLTTYPEGGTFDPSGNLEAQRQYRSEMFWAFLAGFVLLGADGGGGGYSLVQTLGDIGTKAMSNVLQWMAGSLNELAQRLQRWTFGADFPVEQMAYLEPTGIEASPLVKYATEVQGYIEKKGITLHDGIEDALLSAFNLPDRPAGVSRSPAERAGSNPLTSALGQSARAARPTAASLIGRTPAPAVDSTGAQPPEVKP